MSIFKGKQVRREYYKFFFEYIRFDKFINYVGEDVEKLNIRVRGKVIIRQNKCRGLFLGYLRRGCR